jgi:hypothetical protein
VNMYNTGQNNQVGMYDAGLQTQAARDAYMAANNMSQFNANNANQMGQFNANYGLQFPQVFSGLADAQQRRELSALAALLGTGSMQQQTAQGSLNTPWDTLAKLFAATPGVNNVGGTSSGTTQTSGTGSEEKSTTVNPLGTATGLLTFLKGLSDEREKTNKQKVGKDPQTGVDLYAYDYKADVAAARKSGKPMPPKRVGPMAQDLERAHPGSTETVGGKKVVKGGALRAMMGG